MLHKLLASCGGDPIQAYGRITRQIDDLTQVQEILAGKAIDFINETRGEKFKGEFIHSDNETYQVQRHPTYPNAANYDDDGELALAEKKIEVAKKNLKNANKDRSDALDAIVEKHPLMKKDVKSVFKLIRLTKAGFSN